MRPTHRFENGTEVYLDHLTTAQRERYALTNLHEPEEEPLFVSAIMEMPDKAVFASVGTAIGYYALLAKKLRPDLEVHCFDPLPRHVQCLSENILLNGFLEKDFKIHPVAVSNHSGTAEFLDNSYASSIEERSPFKKTLDGLKAFLKGRCIANSPSRSLSVRSLTLADAFGLVGCKTIHLLQMDIQGHELAVLSEFFKSPANSRILEFILGTHGLEIHSKCRGLFLANKYGILRDKPFCPGQPDGFIHAQLKE